ncbi:hypothetical protein BDR05DRAFT_1005744 [Suillus weaverae]|nr:hypothetical protein BDR05DRAFT_1005744 [Suillus weaverae]
MLVGDEPDHVVSTASDHFHVGVRALCIGDGKGTLQIHNDDAKFSQATVRPTSGKQDRKMKPRTVNYAWVNVMSDVDWEGADVRDSLGAALAMAVEEALHMSKRGKGKMKAVFSGGDGKTQGKVVLFENMPQAFVCGGGLDHGGTVVSRIAG